MSALSKAATSRRIPNRLLHGWSVISGQGPLSPAHNFARLRVHAYDFAFLNEKGHAHDEPGFDCRLFGGATGGGVAAQTQFG